MAHRVASTGTHWPTPLANAWPPFYVAVFVFFYFFLFYVRLRLCYCYSALCPKLIQTWGTLVVTAGKDENVSGFSECEIRDVGDTCEAACLRYRLEHAIAVLSLRPDRYCVSSIDTDESQMTGKYDWYTGIRNVIFGVFCNAIINLKISNG